MINLIVDEIIIAFLRCKEKNGVGFLGDPKYIRGTIHSKNWGVWKKKKKNIVESGNWLTIGAQKHLLSWIERNEDRFCHALLHPNNFWG